MKVVEVTNVDFSLRHFLLPLMRGIRARGHEVVGVCAEGPLLDDCARKVFAWSACPSRGAFSRSRIFGPFASWSRCCAPSSPICVHAHMPISGFLARLAARVAGVPRIAYTCHGFLFNQDGPAPRRGWARSRMEWLGGRLTDIFLAVSAEEAEDARRLRISRRPVAVGNGRDPAIFHPEAAARARIRAELGTPDNRVVVIAVSRLVRDKGYPELLEAMRALPEAELWVVGERLASDRGDDIDALFAASGLGSPAPAAGLSA